jgi:hypothetical protein
MRRGKGLIREWRRENENSGDGQGLLRQLAKLHRIRKPVHVVLEERKALADSRPS